MRTILAIDDESSVRAAYKAALGDNYELLFAEHGAQGLELIETHHADLILLDLTMPKLSGQEVLRRLQEQGSTTPVVVVSASDTVTAAVACMKLGAADYVLKPFDLDALLLTIDRLLAGNRARNELKAFREKELTGFDSIIGSSPRLLETLQKARQAMDVRSTVLITGENGTGKDLVARAIHTGGPRADHAFVPLSCCAIPSQLIESELFGYEKGSFTGADERRTGKLQVADGGTLFLDEIGEMPMDAQVKLLRVLQDSAFFPIGSHKEIRVDIRVISATNRNLMEAIKQNIFREDLYYRLNVLHIEMPALRERREDIPELVAHFMAKHGPRVNAKTKRISQAAMTKLAAHRWPGNVRELENTVERILVYYGTEEVIEGEHAAALLPSKTAPDDSVDSLGELENLPLEEATQLLERRMILRALEQSNQVVSRAADMLGTTRRILKYKMDQLGLISESVES